MSKALPHPTNSKDLYETMLEHSTEARWYIHPNGLWSESTLPPTRERLIESEMKIGRQSKSLVDGKWQTDVRYLTRAEAEEDVDRWLALTQSQAVA